MYCKTRAYTVDKTERFILLEDHNLAFEYKPKALKDCWLRRSLDTRSISDLNSFNLGECLLDSEDGIIFIMEIDQTVWYWECWIPKPIRLASNICINPNLQVGLTDILLKGI